MEVEIWKLRDQSSDLKGRPLRVHCASLVEVHKGMMNLKLRNGNYARKVLPQFARRIPTKPSDLPSFIKMNSDVEAKFIHPDGNVVYELGQVLTFLGKEDLVLKLYHDERKAIVARKDCRIPSNMPNLNNYKEIDRLKKFNVDVETVVPESLPEPPSEEDDQKKEDPVEDDEEARPQPQVHQETQTIEADEEEAHPLELEDNERFLTINSLMSNYQQKVTGLATDMELKLSELSSDYRGLEAKVMETIGKVWPSTIAGGGMNKSSLNSIESDERSFSDTPNPTPPPSIGFPQQQLLHGGGGIFFPHQSQFGSFPGGFFPLGAAPLAANNNNSYTRRTLADKIYPVISQKYGSEESMKITEEILSAIL